MDEQFPTFTPTKQNSSKKTRAFLYVGVFILIIAGAIFLGNQLLGSSSDEEPTPTPAPTVAVTPTEEPTPTEDVADDKKTTPTVTKAPAKTTVTPSPTSTKTTTTGLNVKVLNGTGVSGAAGEAASLLKGKGYTVASAGNADNFDYTDTVIQIKKSKQASLAKLKTDLSSAYTVSSSTETLAETEDVDAIVIVGTSN